MDSPKPQRDQSNVLEEKVRTYYDDNTKLFLKLGADGGSRAIHQPLYLKPDFTVEQAMHAHHELILRDVMQNEVTSVLDLGCGVGASMFYLARATPPAVTFTGITLSPQQAAVGRDMIKQLNLGKRVRILSGNFQDLPPETGKAQLAYAIESWIHATDMHAACAQLGKVLVQGGRCIVFDDFCERQATSQRERRILRDFRDGWQAYGLHNPADLGALGAQHGLSLTESKDYTDALMLNRPRDRFVRLIAPVARLLTPWSSYCSFLVGGNARQLAYRHGLLQYGQLVFERQ